MVVTVAPEAPPRDDVRVLRRDVPYKYVVAAVYVSALFLDILDLTIVNVAIPSLGRDFNSESGEWIVLGYTISLAVWMPAAGWLGDRIGTKRVFLLALGMFVGASALCGAAQSMEQLVAARVLQGVGGGMLTPVGLAMLFRTFPPIERARVATIIMIPTLAAPAIGPVLGGLLVTHASWRWIFYVNVPVGIVAFLFGVRYLREDREPSAGRFDLPGFVLAGAGLALMVFALSEGPRSGWTSPQVLATAVIGVICATTMVYVETHRDRPMLDLRLLANRMFRNTNIFSVFAMSGFMGMLFALPLYLQLLRGQDAFHSGLTVFPQAFGLLLSSQIAGRLYKRIGPRRLMFGGMIATTVTMASFVTIDLDTSLWQIQVLMFARGLCMGFAFVPMQAAGYATIAPADNGRASSLFSTQRQVAVSIGIALVATVLASHMPLSRPPEDMARALDGYRIAFGVAAALALCAAFAALFIRDSDAAASMEMHPVGTAEEPQPISA